MKNFKIKTLIGLALICSVASASFVIPPASILKSKLVTAVQNALVPAGTVISFAGADCPSGYLVVDGTAVSRTTYAELFTAIGTIHGVGDGTGSNPTGTTFTLPDLRGTFIRYSSNSGNNDPNRTSRTAAVASTWTRTDGATTNSSATVTVGSTLNIAPGMTVTGTNIPASSIVGSIDSSTTFSLRDTTNTTAVLATGTASGTTLTFSKASTANYVGSLQGHAFTDHTHIPRGLTAGGGTPMIQVTNGDGTLQTTTYPTLGASTGAGSETRPINAYMRACIKY